jgi:hypothetical protein
MSICFRKLSVPLRLLFFVPFISAFVACGLAAQTTTDLMPATQAFNVLTLRQLTRSSGYIFAGTVTAIQPVKTAPNRLATIRITFRVDQAIRGVRVGQFFTAREWAGLWGSAERYRAGQRLLLFLYPTSKLGLTSPVGGSQGRFALDSRGEFVLGQERTIANPLARSPWNGNKLRVGIREFRRAIRQAEEEE